MENLDLTPSSPPPPQSNKGNQGVLTFLCLHPWFLWEGLGLLFHFNLTQIVAFANYMLPVLNISTIFRCIQ